MRFWWILWVSHPNEALATCPGACWEYYGLPNTDIFNAPKDMRLKMAQRRVSLHFFQLFFWNRSGTVRKKPAVPVEVCDFLGFLHGLMVSQRLWWRRCLGWPWQRQWEPLWFWKRLSETTLGVGRDGPWKMSMKIQGGLADAQVSSNFQGTHLSPIATSRTAGVNIFLSAQKSQRRERLATERRKPRAESPALASTINEYVESQVPSFTHEYTYTSDHVGRYMNWMIASGVLTRCVHHT